MKPMTEQEARAALKKAMPWAWDRGAVEPWEDEDNRWFSAHVWAGSKYVHVECNAPTLRAAVAKAIRAWNATQKKGGRK